MEKYNKEIVEIINRFHNFNKMEFDKLVANKMACILIKRFGFEQKKFYSHVNQEIQMYNWSKGDGTLFLEKDGYYYKFEIGKDYHNGNGWFCPNVDKMA